MRQSVLTDQQAQFLREEKEALAGMQLTLAGLDLPRESLDSLQKAILQLDELFLIVIAGEFNAGKSALVNALLGEKVLPEGATPTTSRVTLVKWGEGAAEQVQGRELRRLHLSLTAPERTEHCRYARHERNHPPPRTADRRIRPAQRPGALRHLRRPSPDGKRATIPRAHSHLGQEDRPCDEQAGHLRGRCRSAGSAATSS